MDENSWLNEVVLVGWQDEGQPRRLDIKAYRSDYPDAAFYLMQWGTSDFWETVLDFTQTLATFPALLTPKNTTDDLVSKFCDACMKSLEAVAHRKGYLLYTSIQIEKPELDIANNKEGGLNQTIASMNTQFKELDYIRHRRCILTLSIDTGKVPEWRDAIRLLIHEFRHAVQGFEDLPSKNTADPYEPCEVDARLFGQFVYAALFEDPHNQLPRNIFARMGYEASFLEEFSSFNYITNDVSESLVAETHSLHTGFVPISAEFSAGFRVSVFSRCRCYRALSDYLLFESSDGLTIEICQTLLDQLVGADREFLPLFWDGAKDFWQSRLEEFKGYVLEKIALLSGDRQCRCESVLCFLEAQRFYPGVRLCKYIGTLLWGYGYCAEAGHFFFKHAEAIYWRRDSLILGLEGVDTQITESDLASMKKWPRGINGFKDIHKRYEAAATGGKSDTVIDFFFYAGTYVAMHPDWLESLDEIKVPVSIDRLDGAPCFLALLRICERLLDKPSLRGSRFPLTFITEQEVLINLRTALSAPLFTEPWDKTKPSYEPFKSSPVDLLLDEAVARAEKVGFDKGKQDTYRQYRETFEAEKAGAITDAERKGQTALEEQRLLSAQQLASLSQEKQTLERALSEKNNELSHARQTLASDPDSLTLHLANSHTTLVGLANDNLELRRERDELALKLSEESVATSRLEDQAKMALESLAQSKEANLDLQKEKDSGLKELARAHKEVRRLEALVHTLGSSLQSTKDAQTAHAQDVKDLQGNLASAQINLRSAHADVQRLESIANALRSEKQNLRQACDDVQSKLTTAEGDKKTLTQQLRAEESSAQQKDRKVDQLSLSLERQGELYSNATAKLESTENRKEVLRKICLALAVACLVSIITFGYCYTQWRSLSKNVDKLKVLARKEGYDSGYKAGEISAQVELEAAQRQSSSRLLELNRTREQLKNAQATISGLNADKSDLAKKANASVFIDRLRKGGQLTFLKFVQSASEPKKSSEALLREIKFDSANLRTTNFVYGNIVNVSLDYAGEALLESGKRIRFLSSPSGKLSPEGQSVYDFMSGESSISINSEKSSIEFSRGLWEDRYYEPRGNTNGAVMTDLHRLNGMAYGSGTPTVSFKGVIDGERLILQVSLVASYNSGSQDRPLGTLEMTWK